MYNLTRRLRKSKQYTKQKLLLWGIIGLIGFLAIFFVAMIGVFAWYSRDLPSPGKVQAISGNSTVFYDRNGKVIYELYKDKNRIPVDFNDMSNYVKKATVSIEDKNFYQHGGYDPLSILRIPFNFLFRGGQVTGGSTLTQQLVKNSILTSERSVTRKIKEFILSNEVERRYTKDQILGMYLNIAPYGGTYWGIESAAKGYFGKDAKDLTLTESAILAGLPQSPSNYSPYVGVPGAYKGRTQAVLRRMREDGYITVSQEQQSLRELATIKFSDPKLAIEAPHFVFYVRDQIVRMYGEKILDQGLQIKTTLDLDDQKEAEKIVNEEVNKIKYLNATNGGLVALDSKTNQILAMVGSYDFNDNKYGKYNVTLAQRQPGSSIKPITYALAFEKGYTPSTVVMDVQTDFGNLGGKEYVPVNYDGKFRGPVQLRFSLGSSFNIPAVKLLGMVGIRDFMQKAFDMGISGLEPTQTNLDRYGLSVTLGGADSTLLEMTGAYSIFARGGIQKDSTSILEIKDYSGKVIYTAPKQAEHRVVTDGASYLISHILSDNNARAEAFGTSSYLVVPGRTVAVKTGTTDDKRDNWTIGFTKEISVGVWVGNNDNTPMNPRIASGVTGASPIWQRAMIAFLNSKKYKDGIMDKPDSVTALEVDSFLGGLPKDGYPKRSEYFIKGTEPKDISPYYKTLKISKNNGKLANDLEIKLGQYDNKDFIVLTENDPVSTDGVNRWQQGINTWEKAQSDDKYHPPTDVSDTSTDGVVVSILAPGDKSRVDTSNQTVEIKAKVISISDIKNVKIIIDGTEVKSLDGNNHDIDASINGISDGVHTLKIIATNSKDKSSDASIVFGVNTSGDVTPTPHP